MKKTNTKQNIKQLKLNLIHLCKYTAIKSITQETQHSIKKSENLIKELEDNGVFK